MEKEVVVDGKIINLEVFLKLSTDLGHCRPIEVQKFRRCLLQRS
jgi:hypothetical protein